MSSDNTRFTGRVKWFNNQAGYGFITSRVGGDDEKDVFVHHSSVTTQQDQFRYLVQGEYVSFVLSETDDEGAEHRATALDVRGADGGMLMCETRLERRVVAPSTTSRRPQGDSPHRQTRREYGGSRPGPGTRARGGHHTEDGAEWILVHRRQDGPSQSSRGRGGPARRGRGGPPRTHQPRVPSA